MLNFNINGLNILFCSFIGRKDYQIFTIKSQVSVDLFYTVHNEIKPIINYLTTGIIYNITQLTQNPIKSNVIW